MPDKNLCVLSDGTGTFSFFFLSSFWEGVLYNIHKGGK
jgi:hypothetical protein